MLRYVRPAVLALIIMLTATAASAAECASRADIIAFLKENFGEVEVGQGLSSRGYLMEVFASPAGTWTILLSLPDGHACLADSGEAWGTMPSSPQALQLSPLALPESQEQLP